MKMYAQLGTLWSNGDLEETSYKCGSYAVACKRGSAEETLVVGLLADNHTFLYEEDVLRSMEIFRWGLPDWKVKLRIHPKKTIKSLVKARLFIKGEGKDDKEAIRDILDQTSFWAWVYPGAGNEAEGMLRADPEYFFAVLNPQTLSADETRIYNILLERAKKNEKVRLHEIHSKEHYKEYYVTIDSLEERLSPEGITRDDIYRAVERLYEKHCIILHHKVPQYTNYPKWDIFDTYVKFPVGKDIGLKKYTPSIGEVYLEFLEKYYREKAKGDSTTPRNCK